MGICEDREDNNKMGSRGGVSASVQGENEQQKRSIGQTSMSSRSDHKSTKRITNQ